MKPEKPYTWRQTIAWSIGRISHRDGYKEGVVATRFGYVNVYCEDDFTCLRYMSGNQEFSKTIQRNFTDRGLAIVAGRFARTLVGS